MSAWRGSLHVVTSLFGLQRLRWVMSRAVVPARRTCRGARLGLGVPLGALDGVPGDVSDLAVAGLGLAGEQQVGNGGQGGPGGAAWAGVWETGCSGADGACRPTRPPPRGGGGGGAAGGRGGGARGG